MNILLTGGLGFIGSSFVRRNHLSHNILNVDKVDYCSDFNAVKGTTCQFRQLDVCDNLFEKVVCEFKPDWIIHFAAQSHVDKSILSPSTLILNNIISTLNVLEVVRKNRIKLFIISTDEVYGVGDFTEDKAYDPRNPYSASKASGDFLANAYFNTWDIPVVITHSCNNFGPFQYQEKFIPTVIRSIINHKPVPIYGDGQQIRDWIYVEDHCSAIEFLMEHGQFGQHYMIGARHPLTNLQLCDQLCKLLSDFNPKYEFVTDRLGHDRRYVVHPEKLCNLGWKPIFDFDESLKITVQHYLDKWNTI